jgi:hypothetical protein
MVRWASAPLDTFSQYPKGQTAQSDFMRLNHMRQRKRRRLDGEDGVGFVRCRICGDHRRVISARHLSKHDIDHETYMKEYELSPDELIAKAFRMMQSSHPGYHPYTKKGWIAAMHKVYESDGKVFGKYLQHNYPQLYSQGVWIFGDWDNALRAAGFDPDKMRLQGSAKDHQEAAAHARSKFTPLRQLHIKKSRSIVL